MAYLQFGSQQLPLRAGVQRVGGEASADIAIPGSNGVAAVTVAADGSVVIARTSAESDVRVNGVLLGVEPSPLIHGDRVEIGGQELRFADPNQAGSTQYVSSGAIADAVARAKSSGPAKPTLASGGRLVSLVDGREYAIPDAGIVLGRDASADVVIPANEVSRRHAQIAPDADGYALADLSTNGVWVNGTRVEKRQVLGRADVIKVGGEEFRFYADVARREAVVPEVAPVPGPPAAPPAAPAVQGAPARAPLATLEILNEGPTKGERFEIHSPLTNIGRGAHNDIVLANESVSDSHAKLQRRDGGWVVVDIDSTNGTYVGGRRVAGEQRLEGAPDLRFGDVKLGFRPAAGPVDTGKGTRAIATGAVIDEAKRAAAQRRSVAAPSGPAQAPESGGGSSGVWWVIVALVLVGAAVGAYFLIGS